MVNQTVDPAFLFLTLDWDGDGNPIGGAKVIAENGWFAARPSGAENVYKIYAESLRSPEHLQRIQEQAQEIVMTVLAVVSSNV